MAETHIQWSQRVWNPTTGCDKVSPGCGLSRPGSDDEETGKTGGCYAMAMAKRLKGMGQAKYQNDGDPRTSGPGFGVTIHPDALGLPLRWRKPSKIFVNSMSDLFHEAIPDDYIAKVWEVMAATPQHSYQLLTKRHGRMRAWFKRWPNAVLTNLWTGVSVENQQWADIRIPALLQTPASLRWISAEPLLGPLNLRPWLGGDTRLDWVVVGGESGPGARLCDPEWIRTIVQDCRDFDVPVFVKQLGSVWAQDWCVGGKTVSALGDPKGGDPQYWPFDLAVREFPQPAEVSR